MASPVVHGSRYQFWSPIRTTAHGFVFTRGGFPPSPAPLIRMGHIRPSSHLSTTHHHPPTSSPSPSPTLTNPNSGSASRRPGLPPRAASPRHARLSPPGASPWHAWIPAPRPPATRLRRPAWHGPARVCPSWHAAPAPAAAPVRREGTWRGRRWLWWAGDGGKRIGGMCGVYENVGSTWRGSPCSTGEEGKRRWRGGEVACDVMPSSWGRACEIGGMREPTSRS